jgi:hypothetical protein
MKNIVAVMKHGVILLGTGLELVKGEIVDIYPATNIQARGMFYACKRGGQDGVLVEAGDFIPLNW